MGFVIRKTDSGREMWLRTSAPSVTWSPRENAHIFVTDRLALQALARLPHHHKTGAHIVAVEG